MKPFNLEEALAGKYCVTRDGRKVRLIFDKSELELATDFPLVGYIFEQDGWIDDVDGWGKDGNYFSLGQSNLDIVGLWEVRQPEVTITIPTPLKEAEDGQEVWYLKYDVERVSEVALCKTYPEKATFSRGGSHLVHLLDVGQLFNTKEDCQTWLDVMKGARR